MWRADSAARVADLTPQLTQNASTYSSDEVGDLGHLIHHFQDATVPAHVVPVAHSFWDGFETFDFKGDISSGLTCDQIAAFSDTDLETILHDTAVQTLQFVRASVVNITATTDGIDNQIAASLSAFWIESADNNFGQYGYLGNNFGKAKFTVNEINYSVPADFAPTFKQHQMRAAVVATLRGLMWQLGPKLIAGQKVCVR